MDFLEAVKTCPHLASPAMLARADTDGKWVMHKHHAVMNRALMEVPFVPGSRLIINAPFQHGKSELGTHYFPAWTLLLQPLTRILMNGHGETFSTTWGSKVKDTIDRFGPEQGVNLKEDTQAKGEWKIA